jgi:hypothetical protein
VNVFVFARIFGFSTAILAPIVILDLIDRIKISQLYQNNPMIVRHCPHSDKLFPAEYKNLLYPNSNDPKDPSMVIADTTPVLADIPLVLIYSFRSS